VVSHPSAIKLRKDGAPSILAPEQISSVHASGANRALSAAAQAFHFRRKLERRVFSGKLRRGSRSLGTQDRQALERLDRLAKNLPKLPRRPACDVFE
jgi:hypothetical protein